MNKAIITAEQADAQYLELKEKVLEAITAHMKNLIGTNYIDVENAGKLIKWPEHEQLQLLVMVQIAKKGKIYTYNELGEVDLLSLEFSAPSLINILDAIEETITIKE